MVENNKLHGYALIFNYLSIFLLLIGIIILIPLGLLIFYPEETSYAPCFIIPGVLSILVGYTARLFSNHKEQGRLTGNQPAVLVVCIWIMAIIVASFPFLLTGKYNFIQSIYETTSGLSTTGLSVVDVATCPHIFLFFRSLLLFVGGVGLVLVVTCAVSDRYNLKLYTAEGHTDKLLPNLARSARLIMCIYLLYIVLGIIAYVIAGMPLFDAVNHSIASLSTGGFSTRPDSIYGYHSIAIDVITDVLMLLGGTSFVIHLFLLRGKIKNVLKHCETKFFLVLLFIFVPILSFILILQNNQIVGNAINVSIFQFISCMSTTGFQNVESMAVFPSSFRFLLIGFMLIGGSMGSTSGGIKQYRIIAMLKGARNHFSRKNQNYKVVDTYYINRNGEDEVLTKDESYGCSSYAIIYLLTFAIGTFIISLFGFSFEDSMFEFASSIGTVGLSSGIISFDAHPVVLLTSLAGMFLGRLEILVIFNAIAQVKGDVKEKFKHS